MALVLLVALSVKGSFMSGSAPPTAASRSPWRFLASLPMAMAGQCVGTAGKSLVVAGGSTWTAPPWSGGVKAWSSAVYSLHSIDGFWSTETPLPAGIAYGASAQWNDSLLCVGGQDATQVFDSVLRFRSVNGKILTERLPNLPRPLTNASAVVFAGILYVIGGQHNLTPAGVSKEIWSLRLEDGGHYGQWEVAPASPWDHARILPLVVGCGDFLYVMSGADLSADVTGASSRTYLKDAWRRDAAGSWKRLPDLPAAVVAAPASCSAHGAPVVFGGDDGELADQIQTLRDRHPGFSRKVYEMDPVTAAWTSVSELPVSLVTTAAARWRNHYVIAGGENQPGHRSARVIARSIAR
jgi:N-acetylneuraminic acid mutarotase